MKPLIAPLLASASFALLSVCGLVAASGSPSTRAVHRFDNLDSAIWTSKPVKIDRATQNFERIAPEATMRPIAVQTFEIRDPLNSQPDFAPPLSTRAVDGQIASSEPAPENAWCHARYRSYRDADNTYQPLSGGPRRQCIMRPRTISINQVAEANAIKPTVQ